jgi:hypothetical protein
MDLTGADADPGRPSHAGLAAPCGYTGGRRSGQAASTGALQIRPVDRRPASSSDSRPAEGVSTVGPHNRRWCRFLSAGVGIATALVFQRTRGSSTRRTSSNSIMLLRHRRRRVGKIKCAGRKFDVKKRSVSTVHSNTGACGPGLNWARSMSPVLR